MLFFGRIGKIDFFASQQCSSAELRDDLPKQYGLIQYLVKRGFVLFGSIAHVLPSLPYVGTKDAISTAVAPGDFAVGKGDFAVVVIDDRGIGRKLTM
jgi:hypothetical protein